MSFRGEDEISDFLRNEIWKVPLKCALYSSFPLAVHFARVCHTEQSKSEREKQISYIKACMWNLEKWSICRGSEVRERRCGHSKQGVRG